jgi:hypothetical protein
MGAAQPFGSISYGKKFKIFLHITIVLLSTWNAAVRFVHAQKRSKQSSDREGVANGVSVMKPKNNVATVMLYDPSSFPSPLDQPRNRRSHRCAFRGDIPRRGQPDHLAFHIRK